MTSAVQPSPLAESEPDRIADLRPGQRFAGAFACVRKDRLTARNGSTYLALELRDRSGKLPARIFREADRIGLRFQAGDAVEVQGRIERFRGELVAELDDVKRLEPGSYDPADFLPAAYRSVEELEGFLEHLAGEIHHDGLRQVAAALVLEGPHAADFRRAPCTRWGHHAYLGGLIEHTVAVGTLVLETCQLHPRLNPDLLLTAALVHDIGKVREFTYAAEFGISEEGKMLGHLQLGATMVGAAAQGLDPELRLALLNCVLSHHGPPDGGRGGDRFATPEALALYRVNALDAGVKGALESGLGRD
ncbi:MAG TPA: HD domain-containing protein [Solirubrobacterales bacterium]|nr:HD domain-containing protein [Solirubrobacterales bacterium]